MGRINRSKPVDKPIEMTGFTKGNNGVILYIGNGANKNDYEAWFNTRGINGRSYSGVGGIGNECALQYVYGNEFNHADINMCFKHPAPRAVFSGFTLRMKQDHEWLWYSDKYVWQPLSDEDIAYKKFFPGDCLPNYESDEPVVYILESHWLDADGNSMDCGYRMFRNKCMAHALGGYKENVRLNSTRGFLYNVQKKRYRYYETDILLTSDEKLFMSHGFKERDCKRYGIEYENSFENITSEMIKNVKIYGERPIDAHEFYRLLKILDKNISVEIDLQDVAPELAYKKIEHLIEDFRYDRKALDRLIIQIYSEDAFRAIEKVWKFETIQYSVKGNIDRIDEIITFCLDNGICAVAVRAGECTPRIARRIKNAGLFLLAYTIKEDVTYANTVLSYGVDTICTDFITENKLEKCNTVFGAYPFKLLCQSGDVNAVNGYDNERKCKLLKSGFLEVVEAMDVCNDGTFQMPECLFDVPGKQFAGWKAYVRRDNGIKLFYCEDTLLRTVRQQGSREAGKAAKIYMPGMQFPVFNVREKDKVFLVATWRDLE